MRSRGGASAQDPDQGALPLGSPPRATALGTRNIGAFADEKPFETLAAATLIAAAEVLQLVRDRDGTAGRPLADVFDPADQVALEAVCATLEGKTARQQNPHSLGSLAYTAWVCAQFGGWTGYYGRPGPVVTLRGLLRFRAIAQGWVPGHTL